MRMEMLYTMIWNCMLNEELRWYWDDREDMSICDEDDVIDVRMIIKIK